MAYDPYMACPCGSGKKFKWCCQPVHVHIDKAFRQDAEGQHEVALKTMDEVCAQHPDNPEVWGRKAQLLYQMGKVEEAEETLEKAFTINPSYAFGYYLRGRFRHLEGEIVGALLLFRKAVEIYDPIASSIIAQLYSFIADCEMKLNRPIAARAALESAARLVPGEPQFRTAIEQFFGAESVLPPVVRKEYALRPLAPDAPDEKKSVWRAALDKAAKDKLPEVVKALEQLTTSFADDPSAWFNLGLGRAWLGDNAGAVAALQRSVELDTDEQKAAETWALAEVLLVGDGMEEQGDFVRHSASFQIRDMNQLITVLKALEGSHRLLAMQARPEESYLAGMVLEKVQGLTQEHTAAKAPRTGAYLTVLGAILQLTNINRERLELVVDEFRQLAPGLLGETHWQKSPPNFSELLGDGFFYPVQAADEAAATSRMVELFGNYLEQEWIHAPRRSLGNVPPIDAVGHGVLRKKLRGIILFIASCAGKMGEMYDFDRLRRKLRLLESAPGAEPQGPDIGALGTAELAALNVESLTDEQLEQAFQSALKLDAREVAGKFARLVVSRQPTAERPDRFPMVNHLVQTALSEGDTAAALATLAEGEKLDAEHNESKRANDYGLRRGQIHAKRGEIDQATAAFEQLFARSPTEVRYRGSAAEAMLAAKQPAKALQFAEEGLKKSREQNNRDSEQYFLELAAAARKQAG